MATYAPNLRRRVSIVICVLIALCGAWGLLFLLSSPTGATTDPSRIHPETDACTGLTEVAQAECKALSALYAATDGDHEGVAIDVVVENGLLDRIERSPVGLDALAAGDGEHRRH